MNYHPSRFMFAFTEIVAYSAYRYMTSGTGVEPVQGINYVLKFAKAMAKDFEPAEEELIKLQKFYTTTLQGEWRPDREPVSANSFARLVEILSKARPDIEWHEIAAIAMRNRKPGKGLRAEDIDKRESHRRWWSPNHEDALAVAQAEIAAAGMARTQTQA